MKTKTRTLTGRALDYAVALAEGYTMVRIGGKGASRFDGFAVDHPNDGWRQYIMDTDATLLKREHYWQPTQTVQGDDIIDREMISTYVLPCGVSLKQHPTYREGDVWEAEIGVPDEDSVLCCGATRREAAMRCWVAKKLGEEVDIPKELT